MLEGTRSFTVACMGLDAGLEEPAAGQKMRQIGGVVGVDLFVQDF